MSRKHSVRMAKSTRLTWLCLKMIKIYFLPTRLPIGAAGSAGCKQAFAMSNALAPKLTDATMQRLNYEVSGKQREPAEVAKE